jgi:16S rRNA (guanine966-N2)-methyltransferase
MLKITGGEFRGRMIEAPRGEQVRPSAAQLRQALFNSLQAYTPDAKVLDLFAGAGALGLEALSRGAAFAVFVEQSKPSIAAIERNIATLKVADRTEVISESVAKAWHRIQRFAPFDLVIADPPYAAGWEMKLLADLPWEELLAPGGHFVLEWGAKKSQVVELPETAANGLLTKIREKKYSDSLLTTYIREA